MDDEPLHVIERIATKYYTFGMNLLQDSNGEKVDVIKEKHILEGPEGITREILKEWIREGGSTCTYLHLLNCLRKSGLGALAEDILGQLRRENAHDS